MVDRRNHDKEKVIEAISALNLTVTTAEVAARTGLSISDSNRLINEVASDTGARLDVRQSGNITYSFAENFKSKYFARGLKAFLQKMGLTVYFFLFTLVKISFGLMLLSSLAIVLTAMLTFTFLLQMGGRRRPRMLINLNQIKEMIFWGKKSTAAVKENGNFLLHCFSFLFGDESDASEELHEQEWQMIAQMIQANDGVIIVEQIAPYQLAPLKSGREINEDAMFSVLCRFEGYPEVTEKGNIVYVFPSLKTRFPPSPPHSLEEKKVPFSSLTAAQLKPVLALAMLNLTGAWWLAFTAHRIFRMYQWQVDVLAIYGTLFVIIPLIRWCCLRWSNARRQARNIRRAQLATQLNAPPAGLQDKLNERLAIEAQHHRKGPDKVIYSTEE
jgi:hypothetical protein